MIISSPCSRIHLWKTGSCTIMLARSRKANLVFGSYLPPRLWVVPPAEQEFREDERDDGRGSEVRLKGGQ